MNHTEERSDKYNAAWNELLSLEAIYNFSGRTHLRMLRH